MSTKCTFRRQEVNQQAVVAAPAPHYIGCIKPSTEKQQSCPAQKSKYFTLKCTKWAYLVLIESWTREDGVAADAALSNLIICLDQRTSDQWTQDQISS